MSENLDKPDAVAFAQAIAANLPSAEDKERLIMGGAAAYILGKGIKYVSGR
jgi:hypothetical protein